MYVEKKMSLFLASVFIIKSYFRRSLNKKVHDKIFCVRKTVYENFSGDLGKNHVGFQKSNFNGLTRSFA